MVAALDLFAHLVGKLVALEIGGGERADHPVVQAVTGELVVQEIDLFLDVVDLFLVQVLVLLRDLQREVRRIELIVGLRDLNLGLGAASFQLSWRRE